MTRMRLELLTDPDMYLFVEHMVKVWHRNICYFDANGLYSHTIQSTLPIGNFEWVEADVFPTWDFANMVNDRHSSLHGSGCHLQRSVMIKLSDLPLASENGIPRTARTRNSLCISTRLVHFYSGQLTVDTYCVFCSWSVKPSLHDAPFLLPCVIPMGTTEGIKDSLAVEKEESVRSPHHSGKTKPRAAGVLMISRVFSKPAPCLSPAEGSERGLTTASLRRVKIERRHGFRPPSRHGSDSHATCERVNGTCSDVTSTFQSRRKGGGGGRTNQLSTRRRTRRRGIARQNTRRRLLQTCHIPAAKKTTTLITKHCSQYTKIPQSITRGLTTASRRRAKMKRRQGFPRLSNMEDQPMATLSRRQLCQTHTSQTPYKAHAIHRKLHYHRLSSHSPARPNISSLLVHKCSALRREPSNSLTNIARRESEPTTCDEQRTTVKMLAARTSDCSRPGFFPEQLNYPLPRDGPLMLVVEERVYLGDAQRENTSTVRVSQSSRYCSAGVLSTDLFREHDVNPEVTGRMRAGRRTVEKPYLLYVWRMREDPSRGDPPGSGAYTRKMPMQKH
ncbi:hypothetical protein PR048_013816 [Dryococelus australis]|uniref:Uncharacterized protein n=1 Tax=Dryococelus australis TaxID=614101 RepID=A0ABQ9HTA4_9NEOP|nr:hypothetical protein PR048_013816 [Dryococelus australis]